MPLGKVITAALKVATSDARRVVVNDVAHEASVQMTRDTLIKTTPLVRAAALAGHAAPASLHTVAPEVYNIARNSLVLPAGARGEQLTLICQLVESVGNWQQDASLKQMHQLAKEGAADTMFNRYLPASALDTVQALKMQQILDCNSSWKEAADRIADARKFVPLPIPHGPRN